MKVGLKLRQGGAKTACRWGWDGDFCILYEGFEEYMTLMCNTELYLCLVVNVSNGKKVVSFF